MLLLHEKVPHNHGDWLTCLFPVRKFGKMDLKKDIHILCEKDAQSAAK